MPLHGRLGSVSRLNLHAPFLCRFWMSSAWGKESVCTTRVLSCRAKRQRCLMAANKPETKQQTQTLGRVLFLDGQGELPMLEVATVWSTAEIYLHGAHVTRFTKKGEPPLLFVSQ